MNTFKYLNVNFLFYFISIFYFLFIYFLFILYEFYYVVKYIYFFLDLILNTTNFNTVIAFY